MPLQKTIIAGAMLIALTGCEMNFNRIATYPVCQLDDASCNVDDETAPEIVAATSDGKTLVFSDSPKERIGFVDITDPLNPSAIGTADIGGEPTSVAVKGNFALVGVNTSFFDEDPAGPPALDDEDGDLVPSGSLKVVDIATRTVVHSIDLGGQPDSVAISPDGNYAAIAIENERNEDHFTLGDNIGDNPQLPAGKLVVIDSSDADPTKWSSSDVDLTGLANVAPTDPEPEYVDINTDNIAVVTLQENNHLVLVDLANASVIDNFPAGKVNLTQIDTTEEDPAIISQTESEDNIPREPDGVAWIGTDYFATADEGDMDGGSRGFTIYEADGDIAFTSGNSLDHLAARLGHYPDDRSGNKGNEPENAEVGTFGDDTLLFVNSERSSLVFVYNVNDPANPVYQQTLPTAIGPEGALAIPSRNLLVVASEEDDRGDKFRGSLNFYQYAHGKASYPTVKSTDRADGTPIPWGAMSGLSADPHNDDILYAIEDSFYASNRIFTLNIHKTPAKLIKETTIMDSNDVFAAFPTSGSVEDDGSFDDVDLAAMINADKSVNLDPEGIAARLDGAGFWIASEGAGTTTNTDSRPIEKLNLIFKTDTSGVIEEVIALPDAINAKQRRFGFEDVTEYNGKLYVAFQRGWVNDTNDGFDPDPRIGVYDLSDDTWEFYIYPLDAPASQNGGWVGLSDITSLEDGEFLVIERDNQGGPDAAIKRLYKFSVAGLSNGDTVTKTLVDDLIDDLAAPGGPIAEKIEGLAVVDDDEVYIINDNDGVDDNSGETQLLNLGDILDD